MVFFLPLATELLSSSHGHFRATERPQQHRVLI